MKSSEELQGIVVLIKYDLELLREKHIHEIEKLPGTPKCKTLADRLEDNLNDLVDRYEGLLKEQNAAADREHFDLLFGLLQGLNKEIADLTKKQPDVLMNSFKVGQINRVLRPLKDIMKAEPSVAYLDLVEEVNENTDKSRNSYSDVAVILCQFMEACVSYRGKHYSDFEF